MGKKTGCVPISRTTRVFLSSWGLGIRGADQTLALEGLNQIFFGLQGVASFLDYARMESNSR
jgi:hypothetical protein